MKSILAPHKEQDGWCYIRVPHRFVGRNADYGWLPTPVWFNGRPVITTALEGHYSDENPPERVISSRRVEEDVETGDYLKRCAEEGLSAVCHATDGEPVSWPLTGVWSAGWCVFVPGGSPFGEGSTLREAYHRYKAAAL